MDATPYLCRHPLSVPSPFGIGRFGVDGGAVVQAAGEIERIAHAYGVPLDLIGPDLEVSERGAAENRGERAVDGVLAAGDLDPADARDVKPCVGREPLAADVDLGVGVEVHVVVRVRETNVRQVSRDVTGGQ